MENPATYCRQTMNNLGKQKKPFLFILDYAIRRPLIIPLEESARYCQYAFHQTGTQHHIEKLPLHIRPISYANYKKAFDSVQFHIQQGNTFLLNLTQPTPISTTYSLDQLYALSTAKYKLHLRDQFVSFSPETFLQITENGTISSYPMKGTIDASIPNAKTLLMEDPKEKAEHATIVDLIRNDLASVSGDVTLEKYRYTETIQTGNKTLIQVSSKITGKTSKNWHNQIGSILLSMLPAGSISGAPKKKTLSIISETEQYDRGYYTGIAGIYNGKTLDSFVIIRYIEASKEGLIYKSGGGITAFSDPQKEYQELIDKIYVPISGNH